MFITIKITLILKIYKVEIPVQNFLHLISSFHEKRVECMLHLVWLWPMILTWLHVWSCSHRCNCCRLLADSHNFYTVKSTLSQWFNISLLVATVYGNLQAPLTALWPPNHQLPLSLKFFNPQILDQQTIFTLTKGKH